MSEIVTVVTIEGSVTPSTYLARGEQRTVRLTERVQRLVDRGYVIIVGEKVEDAPEQVAPPVLAAVPDIEVTPEPPASRPKRGRGPVTVAQTDEAPPALDGE